MSMNNTNHMKKRYYQLLVGGLLVLLVPLAIVVTQRPQKATASWMDSN